MIQILVILSLVLARSEDLLGVRPGPGGLDSWPAYGAWLAPLAAALAAGTVHLFSLSVGRTLDRTGRLSALNGLYAFAGIARWAVLLALGAGCLSLGWPQLVRGLLGDWILVDELLIASPMLLTITATWWSIEPCERRLREAVLLRQLMAGTPIAVHASRWEHVWLRVRHQVLLALVPLAMITAWSECVARAPRWLGDAWPFRSAMPAELAQWVGILAVLILTPWMLRRIWHARQLENGALRDQILGVCRRYGVRVTGPLLWPTHGAVVNGAILGFFRPLRYLLLTDALLEHLTREQVEAVVAHEVAHVRRSHLQWTAVAMLASILLCAWIAEFVARALRIEEQSGGLFMIAATLVTGAVSLLVFGLVSRRFEWQADAFSVAHLSAAEPTGLGGPSPDPHRVISASATQVVAGALQAVAELNGLPTTKGSFRHGSIALRQRKVEHLAGLDPATFPIDRTARRIKWIAGLGLLLALAPLAAPWLV